jgi:hypothetical protein
MYHFGKSGFQVDKNEYFKCWNIKKQVHHLLTYLFPRHRFSVILLGAYHVLFLAPAITLLGDLAWDVIG